MSEQAQHTPAPWNVMDPDPTEYPTRAVAAVYSPTRMIATVWGNEKATMPWRSNDEGEANARLISAAPELLDVLQQYTANDDALVAGTPFDTYTKEYNRIYALAKAVIAKAIGDAS